MKLKRATIGQPHVLAVEFEQRAGTYLHDHRRVWHLRIPLEVGNLQVQIARTTGLRDIHRALGRYSVALAVDQIEEKLPLRELVARGIATPPTGTRYLVECADGKTIRVELKRRGWRQIGDKFDGGFKIRIEVHGNRLCPKNGK